MKNKLAPFLWSGELSRLLSEGERHFNANKLTSAEVCAYIGALVFSGSFEKATVLFEKFQSTFTKEQLSEIYFYLSVGLVRKSRYAEAFRIIKKIEQLAGKSNSNGVQFYFTQSVAFYTYYRSEFKKSVAWAKRSLKFALIQNFRFGELLARDMLGGAFVHAGEVSLGIKEINEALKVARWLGNGSFVDALEVSLIGFQCQFGRVKNPITSLEGAIQKVNPQDDYSLSDLNLELARQLILRGRVSEAEKVLNDCAPFIYKSQNKRQSSTIHLRLATIMYAKGQSHQALTLLQVAEQSLSPKLDQVYLSRLSGLRERVLRELGIREEHPGSLADLRSDWIGERISKRRSKSPIRPRKGEDPLGDHIDQILSLKVEEAVKEIIKEQLWFFLPEILDVSRAKEFIATGLEKNSLTLFSKGDVIHLSFGKKSLNSQILQELSQGPKSKRDLINKIWGYEYDPLRHDSLVYVAISGLRKSLKAFSHWVEAGEDYYNLRSGVQVIHWRKEDKQQSLSVDRPPQRFELKTELNYRQNEWLNLEHSKPYFSIKEYKEHFEVSHMTALRDLSELLDEKILRKTGHARATRYYLAKSIT